MPEYDRLTTLLQRFKLNVTPVQAGHAGLVIALDGEGAPKSLLFSPIGGIATNDKRIAFAAILDWDKGGNPLFQSLPDLVDCTIAQEPNAQALARLICHEAAADRCGSASVLNRLCEVLVVRILRHLMLQGHAETGLLAGLSDPRLSRAIVSMHDLPDRLWTADDLAYVAGLSLSRFSELFVEVVGETPMAYLRRWRLILARQDLISGDRVSAVAHRYGYGSTEGFSRAFRRHYGKTPIQMRREVAA
ncbi:transcriptional activator FtrA [Roseovarius albus]|uniref:Transcriptional activator FtrA n=1 Tax=Roseovarius albus TaxID=1247867 RepID=A0A1X6ZUF1_9RHOB|nr:AraC family transcriptional regulator [Roseovarius albus]SLN61579.1 transcriptional activator FtrA [Roseovarius albus]